MEDSFEGRGTELEDHSMRAGRFMIKAEQELKKLRKAYPDLRYEVLNQTELDMEMSDGMAKMALEDGDEELANSLSRQAHEDDINSAIETTVSVHVEADVSRHIEAAIIVLGKLADLEKGVRLPASREPDTNPIRNMKSLGPEKEDLPVLTSYNLYKFEDNTEVK